MSTSNWRSNNKMNLAMAAELTLGGGGLGQPSAAGQPLAPIYSNGGVPRVRGNFGDASDPKDIFNQIIQPKGAQNSLGNNRNFASDNDYNNSYNGPSNPTAYGKKPNGNAYGEPTDSLSYLGNTQSTAASGNGGYRAESDGFKVQRVRGVAVAAQNTSTTGFGAQSINSNGFGAQNTATGSFGSINQQQTNGFSSSNNNNPPLNGFNKFSIAPKRDENTDIDKQTQKIKGEIDSLDQKLNFKSSVGGGLDSNADSASKGGSFNFHSHKSGQSNNEFNKMGQSDFNAPQSTGFGSAQKQTISAQQDKGGLTDEVSLGGAMKKIQSRASLPVTTNVNVAETQKEFLTGTYDPSNILGGTRTGRMRSLGKNQGQPKNQHDEKAAQASGSKLLPDEQAAVDQFVCPEGCGRSFNKKALEKHIPLCKKLFQPKKEVPEKKTEVQGNAAVLPNANDGNKTAGKQLLPPKAAKKPVGAVTSVAEAKNEALRKLKEQRKKEIENQSKNGQNQQQQQVPQQQQQQHNSQRHEDDDDVISENGGYF